MGVGVGVGVDVGVGVGVGVAQIQSASVLHAVFLQFPVVAPAGILQVRFAGHWDEEVQTVLHWGTGVGDGVGEGVGKLNVRVQAVVWQVSFMQA